MKIIDTHVHLGTSKFSGVATTAEDIIAAMDAHGIAASLVMPQPTLEDIPAVHEAIARLAKEHPRRIYGIAAVDPWLSEAAYRQEIAACVQGSGFVAIKLHPLGHNISPMSPECDKVYECARQFHVPVIVHTGFGTPFSLPSLMIEPAKKFGEVTFILAHAGFAVYTDEAIVAAKCCENIVLEPSWCPTYTVVKMVRAIGSGRMLMGSDHISNLPVELTKFHSIGLSDGEKEQIFYENAKRIFRLDL